MQRPRPDTADAPATWILSDGRAGNLRQAAALADALGIDSARHWPLAGLAPWRWLAPRRAPFDRFAFGSAFARALDAPPTLAIGCGRQAALATRLARAKGARAVQILDPRMDPRHWDVVIAPEHDGLHGENVLSLLGSLHPVDDAWLARARADFDALAQLPRPRVALLVGGPTRDSGMDDGAFARMLARVEGACLAEGGSLLATASRRTPGPWRQRLQGGERPRPPGITWLGEGGGDGSADANPYPGLLAWADRIVCTPDSVNMVSEACATRVPVFVADPDRASGRPRKFLDALRARERIRPVDDALSPYPVSPLRETARVAGELRERLAA
ncbi:ELM1/GtrOC1 family putative glycosyltransferase [Luteimonas pelagia]